MSLSCKFYIFATFAFFTKGNVAILHFIPTFLLSSTCSSVPVRSRREIASCVFRSAGAQQVKRSPADPMNTGLILINLQLACQSPGCEKEGGKEGSVEAGNRRPCVCVCVFVCGSSCLNMFVASDSVDALLLCWKS